MPLTLKFGPWPVGRPVYALVWQDATRTRLWAGTGWAPDSPAARGAGAVYLRDYAAINLPDDWQSSPDYGSSGVYSGPLPASVPPGRYTVAYYCQDSAPLFAAQDGPLGADAVEVCPPAAPGGLPDLAPGIAAAAAGPAVVTLADGRSATAQRLPDLIAADAYLTRKAAVAAGRSPFAALRRARVAFGGAV